MKIIIDRFEGDQVVVELPDRTIKNIDKKLLPTNVKVGDVISIVIDKKNTDKRKKEIDNLASEVWAD